MPLLINAELNEELRGKIDDWIMNAVNVFCVHLPKEGFISRGQWEAILEEFLPDLPHDSTASLINEQQMEHVVAVALGEQRFTCAAGVHLLTHALSSILSWILQVMRSYLEKCTATDQIALFGKVVQRAPILQRLSPLIIPPTTTTTPHIIIRNRNEAAAIASGEYTLHQLSSLPIFQK